MDTVSLIPGGGYVNEATTGNLFIPGMGYASATFQAQLLLPTADITDGSWTPSSGTDLFAVLDEPVIDSANYISTTTDTSCEIRLGIGNNPTVNTGHIIRYRILAGLGYITVVLKQGATTIASFGPHLLTREIQDFEQYLTENQASSISDYSDLRMVFTTTS